MNYSERVGQVDLRGYLRPEPGPITALHEIIAPAIGTLPRDLADHLKQEFYFRIDALPCDAPAVPAPGLYAPDWSEKYKAHDWLADEVAALRRASLDIAFDEEAIDEESRKWVAICRSLITYEAMLPYVRAIGVDVPEIKNTVTAAGIAKRFQDMRWWRRQFRKHYTRAAENKMRELGYVQKRKQLYATDRAVNWRRIRRIRDKAMLQELQAVSDQGDQLELWSIIEKSQANPALRRAELMVRMKGFEEVSDEAGHVADFYTLTAPSAYHCTNKSGSHNQNYEHKKVREAQAWLCKMWARVRAKLKRLSIIFYGFRIAEPHHDATPHWHVIMFYRPHDRDAVRTIIRSIWLSEFADEPGACEHRTEVKSIDKAKGSACGYVSKYIAKNIDGFQVGEDFEADTGTQAQESCQRVATWASVHGVRQFQQIGGPQVGIWRELRRIRAPLDQCDNSQKENGTKDRDSESSNAAAMMMIERARLASEVPSWSGFINAIGGIARGRNGDVQLLKEISGELTRYDELRGAQVIGLQANTPNRTTTSYESEDDKLALVELCSAVPRLKPSGAGVPAPDVLSQVRTRTKCWRIERKTPEFMASSNTEALSRGSKENRKRDGLEISASSLFPLGLVSLTVRSKKRLTLEEIARRYLSRGDPPMLH